MQCVTAMANRLICEKYKKSSLDLKKKGNFTVTERPWPTSLLKISKHLN